MFEAPWTDIKVLTGQNDAVKKYVFTRHDAVAEAVLYRYPTYEERTVICCSTQSGCPIGCRFCGAGDRFVRSLTADEIIAQPIRLINDTGIDDPATIRKLQIMFMSMGEPLLNQHALISALFQLYEIYPNAALLISTSAPDVNYETIRMASRAIRTVGLQFSVHESTDERRNALIPFPRKLTLAQIAREGELWAEATGRQPFFNYCAHEKNNTVEDADRLLALFKPEIWQATVSVVCERDEQVAAANERQRELAREFMALLGERGFSTRMFDPAGQDDIGGGCGQLWYVQEWMREHGTQARGSAGMGLPVLHAPGMR